MTVVSLPRPVRPPVGFSYDVEITGVVIATPCYGGMVHADYVHALGLTQTELDQRGIPHAWVHIDNESLIQRARNRIAAEFMARKASHLVFIDSDIEWQPLDLIRLLSHDKDVVCGVYPKKNEKLVAEYTLSELQAQIDWFEWHKRTLLLGHERPPRASAPPRPADWPLHPKFNAQGISRYDERTGAIELNSAPTGFLCLKRCVFARMAQSGVVSKIEAQTGVPDNILPHLYDYFWCGVEEGILWSEDYGFSRKWREIGGEIWLDPAIKLIHIGRKAYDGDPCTIYSEPDQPILSLEMA